MLNKTGRLGFAAALVLAGTSLTAHAELELSAYGVLGVDQRSEFYDRAGASAETVPMLRRLKADLDYNPDNPWRLKLGGHYSLVEFDDERDERRGFSDAYVRYQWDGRRRLQVGRMREPFGFERQIGFSRLATTERSIVSSAFAPGRSLGVKLSDQNRHTTWAVGVFQESETSTAPQAITGRVTRALNPRGDNTLHMGVSASIRDMRDEQFQIREHVEVYRGATVARSAFFRASKSQLLGTELVWQPSRLTLSSELMAQRLERADGKEWLYSGYYVQAGYFLTGEQRAYRRGTLRGARPASSSGAWELVGRFSHVNLRDNSQGSRTGVGVLGINYHNNQDLSLKLHYLKTEITGNVLHAQNTGDAVVLRLQLPLL